MKHLIIIFMLVHHTVIHTSISHRNSDRNITYNTENLKLSGHIISNPSKFNILSGIEVFLSFQQTFRGFRGFSI